MTLTSNLPVPDDIAALIGVYALFQAVEERAEQINIDPPLSRNERHMIVKLGQPQRMGALAEALAIAPSTATAVADSLADRNLTLREHDPSDRRVWRVRLTPEGRKVQAYFVAEAGIALTTSTGLTSDENKTLKQLLKKIHTHLSTEIRKS